MTGGASGMRSPESYESDDVPAQDGDSQDGDYGERQARHSGDSNQGVYGEDPSAQSENNSRNPDPCPPQAIALGTKFQVYDSDDEDNTQVRHASLDKHARRYDMREVRKHLRPELFIPGGSWANNPPIVLPQAKSAELFLAFQKWNKRFSDPYFIRNLKAKPLQRLSAYLAAEVLGQMTTGNSVDTLWAAADVAEEYIRQVLWPRLMLAEAIRIREDGKSEVMDLAKTVPPAYALGYNNDRFWGYAIYMALRFPSGLHPFTTPVVRNALAYLTIAQGEGVSDDENPWMTKDDTMDSTEMALAATWAGYHISHHLLTRNAYLLSDAEIREKRQQLDATVAMVTRKVKLISQLFLDTIEGNGYIDTSLPSEVLTKGFIEPAKWSKMVGTCHRVEYNSTSLPLPICKPSMVLAHLGENGARDRKRPWDDSDDFRFSSEFDEPLDPEEHDLKDSSLQLPEHVAKEIAEINAWLLSFLREESPADPGTDGAPALPVQVCLETTAQRSMPSDAPRAKPSRRAPKINPPGRSNIPGVTTRAGAVSEPADTLKSELLEIKKEVGKTKALMELGAVELRGLHEAVSQQALVIDSLKEFIADLVKAEAEASVKNITAAVQRTQTGEARRLLSTPGLPTPRYDSPQMAGPSGVRNRWSASKTGGVLGLGRFTEDRSSGKRPQEDQGGQDPKRHKEGQGESRNV